ncbi:two-component system sensor histidine kinase NtrB [Ramlibacter sp. Leaf400]|uniref:two-component system sensor histidine kinase NtrB n=1 Tax=Ramlibacter sp. Leaf400 TaxID=1736365 RepID=UPI0006FBE0F4|nr:ATP-binding protein [Ramlibacter sp. Leaf400]KQT12391.1 PAS domain-containing sensor histidine kinase [Ramlibacter sp. Leaf400]
MSPRAAAGKPRTPTVARAPGQRWPLWGSLIALVATLLVTLVWLAGRYEASQLQSRLERDTAEAIADIRTALTRNLQSLQALQSMHATPASLPTWSHDAQRLLHERREMLRLEWRDGQMGLLAVADTPYRPPVFARMGRSNAHPDVTLACAAARRLSTPAYATSYFLPQPDGLGMEVMELCLPQVSGGTHNGYLVATYALGEVLALVAPELARGQEISFTEADGTRLALHGGTRRGGRVFSAQQLLDLPGNTLVLRMDSWRSAPDLFPNVLTALVTAMSIALLSVLFLLGKDMRRRQEVEKDLAEALAFRKAMEDSLVTGLRARDLAGRITYVNPAFCEMVGFTPEELLGNSTPAPYWPPELAGEYQKRQEIRLAGGHAPPREGFESVFMRKDGSRFPVLIIEAPLINAQGMQTGWMSAFLDISEQRRVEELSRASQERLQASARLATVGEMASLLSHELNQPLAAISSYATGSLNLLDARAGLPGTEPADLQLALQRIAQQAERAGRVIKSVHDFVRRRVKAREPVRPESLIEAVLPLVSLQARKLRVRVETRVSPSLPAVVCDRTMVEQVLLNLARNAMQAMDEARVASPSLVIQVRRAGSEVGPGKGWLEFSVADQGPGIPPEVREQLFTPFFTTKAEGMGLGLSLCRTVVEQHGGFLAFEPNRPRGTIFRFTLPTDGAAPAAPSQPAPQGATTTA